MAVRDATPPLPDANLSSVRNRHPGHGPVTACAFHPTDPPFFLGSPSLQHPLSPTHVGVGAKQAEDCPTLRSSSVPRRCNSPPARRIPIVCAKRASRSRPGDSLRSLSNRSSVSPRPPFDATLGSPSLRHSPSPTHVSVNVKRAED